MFQNSTNNDSRKQITKFVDTLYRSAEGFVYSPTLDRISGEWLVRFFKWPNDRSEIIQHIVSSNETVEVYIGPALYKAPTTPTKDNVKGAYSFWAEFDGTEPKYKDIPMPGMMIQSSEKNHIHVYWLLEEFNTSITTLESVNKALAYNLDADSSGWDATQILRPPCTFNHKRNVYTSPLTLVPSYRLLPVGRFLSIPLPDAYEQTKVNLKDLPSLEDAQMDVRWDRVGPRAKELYREEAIPTGERSNSLMALGYYLAEAGASTEQMFTLLLDADSRWGKFSGRRDQNQRLLDIIKRARVKFPLASNAFKGEEVVAATATDILARNLEIDWAIDNLLNRQGNLIISGPPGCGKSQLSMQASLNLAIGRTFLQFPVGRPLKVAMFSLEMNEFGLNMFLKKMMTQFSDEEKKLIDENLVFLPFGRPLSLDTAEGQREFLSYLEHTEYDGLVLDSLGMSTYKDVSDPEISKFIFGFFQQIQFENNMFTWLIHHQRKAQAQNKKPNTLDDLYGSRYIGTNATSVLSLWPTEEKNVLEVKCLKARFTEEFDDFEIVRDPATLSFDLRGEQVNVSGLGNDNNTLGFT